MPSARAHSALGQVEATGIVATVIQQAADIDAEQSASCVRKLLVVVCASMVGQCFKQQYWFDIYCIIYDS